VQGSLPVAIVMAYVATILAFIVHGFRLSAGPDVFSDEGLYLLVGRNLASGAGLVGDRGVFFWHPPLYMLVEAAYLRLGGLLHRDVLDMIFAVRWLNVFFSALTVGLLLLVGHRLHSTRAGVLMAGFFALDPFVQRINRRSMLETLAMLLALLALYIFFTYEHRVSIWRQLGAGIVLGLGILTKEIVAFEVLVLVLFALWARRSQLGDALRVTGIAVATYLVYPAWAFAIGEGDHFLAYKLFGAGRFLKLVGGPLFLPLQQEIRLPPGGHPPLLENLRLAFQQYASTYALLALGALATLVLVLRYRHLVGARYAATWAAVSYAVIGLGTLAGVGDQFFYYVLVPALAVTGLTFGLLTRPTSAQAPSVSLLPPAEVGGRLIPFRPRDRGVSTATARRWLIVLLPILLLIESYDVGQWFANYALGSDNAYTQIYRYVKANVPPGQTLVVGSDVANFLFQPEYDVAFLRSQKDLEESQARYFILSSKEPWGGYNAVTPTFYSWVMQHSHPLIEAQGRTFWTLGLYERNEPAGGVTPNTAPSSPAPPQPPPAAPAG
jgi:hypothetical protein